MRLEESLKPAPGAVVLDAGSGTGRHALYLARMGCSVHAVDVSGAACEALRGRTSRDPGLAGRIKVEQAALGVTDLPDARYDIVIDSYVSCHLLSEQLRLEYLEGLIGLVRPGGVLYTACIGRGDEYYSRRAIATDDLATDPLNGVTKLLQSRSSFRAGLDAVASVEAVTTECFFDEVAGSVFCREILAAALQR